MIMHAMWLIKQSINFLNPGQIPVVTLDQPLYAIAKKVQWTWPNEFEEDDFVLVLGGLHIEMVFMSMIGDVLEGSGWVDALIKSGLGSPGLVESFLSSSYLKRTRYAHEVTAGSLYSLLQQVYQESDCDSSFDDFCDKQVKRHPQFSYWLIIMRLEVILLSFVRSLRQGNFELYIESLKTLAPWMFGLDHINYARWLPIHLHDMLLVKHKHPEICAAFQDGGFAVQPSNKPFSAISIDQAHEMNNKVIKGDGGIIGLTENKSALEHWLVCAPEINLHLLQFEKCYGYSSIENEDSSQFHHEQTTTFQKKFIKDVKALTEMINELGNSFKETSQDLISLETKDIPHPEASVNLTNIEKIGKKQYEEFCKNRLIQQSSSSQSAEMTWRNNRTNCRNSISSNPTTSETPKQMSIFTSISKNKLELFDFSSV